jgi:hypothetical protein
MNSDKWSADYKWIEKFLREINSKSSKQIKRRINTPRLIGNVSAEIEGASVHLYLVRTTDHIMVDLVLWCNDAGILDKNKK